jgi:hypothetical protein
VEFLRFRSVIAVRDWAMLLKCGTPHALRLSIRSNSPLLFSFSRLILTPFTQSYRITHKFYSFITYSPRPVKFFLSSGRQVPSIKNLFAPRIADRLHLIGRGFALFWYHRPFITFLSRKKSNLCVCRSFATMISSSSTIN